jgi:SAM-dependent methyltransferase
LPETIRNARRRAHGEIDPDSINYAPIYSIVRVTLLTGRSTIELLSAEGATAVSEVPTVRCASGDLYEPYVGRWSRLVAREFFDWLSAPPEVDWLDVGCGTGVVTEAIAERCAPRRLAGIDPSAGFLDFARQRLRTAGAELHQADARKLPFAAAQFDRVVSGLVLNFVPDPALAVAEMARVVRSGGEIALYVWDYAGKMELMRHFWDAAIALDPLVRELDEGRRSPICKPEPLRRLFVSPPVRFAGSLDHTSDVRGHLLRSLCDLLGRHRRSYRAWQRYKRHR